MVEAKAPGVPVEQAYREAALYARHLNSTHPAGFNPVNFIIASNGERVMFGHWDANPDFDIDWKKLRPGSRELQDVQRVFGFPALRQYALICLQRLKLPPGRRAFNRAGGQALINAKKS